MPQRCLIVEKVRMEKWDLHLDSRAKILALGVSFHQLREIPERLPATALLLEP